MPDVAQLPHPHVLVLSGGGANGAAQAFAVRELYRQGYVPDIIIGTSIGAWNGAFLAANPGQAGADRLCELWNAGAFFQMARPRGVPLLRAALMRNSSLIGDESIDRALQRTGLDATQWQDAKVPLVLGAIDAETLKLRYWDSSTSVGPLGANVAASSALAPLLPFGRVDGRTYVDAGMQDNYGIPEIVGRLATAGIHDASFMVLDCAPGTPSQPATTVPRATDVALGATFRRHRDEGVALAKSAGHRVDIIEVGGNHPISDYTDPADGERVGVAAVNAWRAGTPYVALWRQPSFLRRVRNVASFTVTDTLVRWGVRVAGDGDRGVA